MLKLFFRASVILPLMAALDFTERKIFPGKEHYGWGAALGFIVGDRVAYVIEDNIDRKDDDQPGRHTQSVSEQERVNLEDSQNQWTRQVQRED